MELGEISPALAGRVRQLRFALPVSYYDSFW